MACSTVDLPTNEERFDRAASGYGVVDVSNQGPGSVGPIPVYGYVNGSVEGPLSKGPLAERAEDLGAQNNGYMPHRRQATPSQHQPEGASRTQAPSVPGSPARRHVMSRGSASGMSGKGSAQGYQLPPTPPSGGRGSRGRRNSAGGRYVLRVPFVFL